MLSILLQLCLGVQFSSSNEILLFILNVTVGGSMFFDLYRGAETTDKESQEKYRATVLVKVFF